MLEAIFGAASKEKVLLFLLIRKSGYAREICTFFGLSLSAVQKTLENLELGGVLISRSVGRTRVFELNPRYAFLNELENLLAKAFEYYPAAERERLTMVRARPRRKGKPL
ncbi:hypothetical protein Selin_0935 [Desulfurispirillum indicum S5]|uniref:Regulatory protein ArsR n=1 Tax=Desulfurispirillum indicum (strain ATCC BAA-1389 / DSM 22839 / S5) TaxID=653733 RepID=E6W312_DESIS|nr:winged helix-turn-helix domain-containing protein [Desulfurispirillum indicum]ADU65673.1 hypothetical protein Selin_0935 [Desulfurispirillum indicum S5]